MNSQKSIRYALPVTVLGTVYAVKFIGGVLT